MSYQVSNLTSGKVMETFILTISSSWIMLPGVLISEVTKSMDTWGMTDSLLTFSIYRIKESFDHSCLQSYSMLVWLCWSLCSTFLLVPVRSLFLHQLTDWELHSTHSKQQWWWHFLQTQHLHLEATKTPLLYVCSVEYRWQLLRVCTWAARDISAVQATRKCDNFTVRLSMTVYCSSLAEQPSGWKESLSSVRLESASPSSNSTTINTS